MPGTRVGPGAGTGPEAVDAAGPWWPGAAVDDAVTQTERVVRSRVPRAAPSAAHGPYAPGHAGMTPD